ncbi:chorismate lyase [Aquabacterium sp. A7-Y]|uniref:chorismate--pyruvate lyase family protein n=1 Tax=Aquabacterium sp. A7-Y TaxID=1349605 RepID=UPI00223E7BAB|nr:chorismate lyase [Aquabacterium sp. A7-Y]MCW7539849.1 chorismate lyase [Aquabacterium sp. A7-Y]
MQWLPHPPLLRPLRRWLSASGSLSARLQQACERFSVQRLRQGASPIRYDEAQALARQRQRRGHAREVVLRCDGEAVVYARSVVAAPHVRGPWRALIGLGSRPLAQLLFQQRPVDRSPLAYARVPRCGPARRRIESAWREATGEAVPRGALWARRSVFAKRGCRLWLMEVFSPDIVRRRRPGR